MALQGYKEVLSIFTQEVYESKEQFYGRVDSVMEYSKVFYHAITCGFNTKESIFKLPLKCKNSNFGEICVVNYHVHLDNEILTKFIDGVTTKKEDVILKAKQELKLI